MNIDVIYDGVRKHILVEADERLDKIALGLMQLYQIREPVALWIMELGGCRALNLDWRVSETDLKPGSVVMVDIDRHQQRGAQVA